MSNHIRKIKKGKNGGFSKIREEFQELKDARKQKNSTLEISELSDLIIVIEKYSIKKFGLDIQDLISINKKINHMKIDVNKLEKLIKNNYRFIGVYENEYLTGLSGDDIKESIKYFYSHYNSTLKYVYDSKNNVFYYGKMNNKPDCRGRFKYSYYQTKTNDFIMNCDELTKPLKKIKPTKINKKSTNGYIDRLGNFYECGFESHKYLAKELFLTKTITSPLNNDFNQNYEKKIDELGWIKISSKRIHFIPSIDFKITDKQKETIIKWMNIVGDQMYEFMFIMEDKYNIEILLKEEY